MGDGKEASGAHVSFQKLEKDDMRAECWSDSWVQKTFYKEILKNKKKHQEIQSVSLINLNFSIHGSWMLIWFMGTKTTLHKIWDFQPPFLFSFVICTVDLFIFSELLNIQDFSLTKRSIHFKETFNLVLFRGRIKELNKFALQSEIARAGYQVQS